MIFFRNQSQRISASDRDKLRILLWFLGSLVYALVFWKLEQVNRARSLTGFHYILGFIVLSGSYFLLCVLRVSQKSEAFSFAFGFLLRLLFVSLLPIFEDDWARYLWDGFQSKTFGSPYGLLPEDFFQDSDPIHAEILSRINHPDWPTIYGPILEIYFFLIHFLFPWKLWALKFFLLIPDLLLFALIRKKYGRKSGIAYWWNPILLKEVFVNAHPDIWGISLLFLAFVLVQRDRFRFGSLVWGISIAVKGFGLLLLPFLFFETLRKKIGIRKGIEALGVAALGFLFPYSIFIIFSRETDLGVAAKFAGGFEFFPLGYSILKIVSGEFSRMLWLGLVAASSLFWIGSWNSHRLRTEEKVAISFFVFFFFSPVLNAWYLLWVLPFLFPRHRSFFPAWSLLFALQFAYLNYANLGEWHSVLEKGYYSHPDWVVGLAVFTSLLPLPFWIRRFWVGRISSSKS